MKKRQGIVVWVILGVVLVFSWACGRKGPPVLNVKELSFRAEQLKAEREKTGFHLVGEIVESNGKDNNIPAIPACRVYHAHYPPDAPPCQGCPVDYESFTQVKITIDPEGRFSCHIPRKKESGTHFFKIRLIGPNGEIGPLSDQAAVTIE